MAQWYYAQNDEQLGPVSAASLKEMAQGGKLGRDDLIWREGMERWAPAHKVRGLFLDEPPRSDEESDESSASQANKRAADNGEQKPAFKSPEPSAKERKSDVVPADDEDESEEGSISGDEETAIDVLPLGGPEESKLHVPVLSAPEGEAQLSENDSDEIVVFEPASSSPPPPRGPRPAESDAPAPRDSTAEAKTRIDVPKRSRAWMAGVGLFLRTFTWVTCLVVILAGGVGGDGAVQGGGGRTQ